MDDALVNDFLLGRFDDGDIKAGCTYLFRGLRVSFTQSWDEQQGEYVSNSQGPKGFECTYRTAVEDVTHVDTIGSLFSGRECNSSQR